MKALIGRELKALNIAYNNKHPALVYGFFGIGMPVIIWLLGPGVTGFYDAEGSQLNVSVVGLVIVMMTVSYSLEREQANLQITFLQTLPVKKSRIVSAKFISVLLWCAITIIWINTVTFFSFLINGQFMEDYEWLSGYFSSLIMIIAAILLLKYFLTGPRGLFITAIVSILIWGGMSGLAAFSIKETGVMNESLVFVLFMMLSLGIYLICWRLSVRRVTQKGFPLNEGAKANRMDPLKERSA